MLAAGAGDDPISAAVRDAPIELRLDDSLKSIAAPMRNATAAMVGVLIGSVCVHAVLLATAVIANRTAINPPQQEIAVDIVQDMKPAEKAKPPTPVKPAKPKVQQASFAAPKSAPAQPSPPKAEPAKQMPPSPSQRADANASKEVEALRKELADLEAQKVALRTSAQETATPLPQTPGGPLARSLQPIVLPSTGADGDVAGYQEIVFSQLAKAKGDGDYHGQAGTTGVHFELDADGHLLQADVAASSGSPALDKEALDIVRRAAPFPPPPKDADHGFFANVNFRPSKA